MKLVCIHFITCYGLSTHVECLYYNARTRVHCALIHTADHSGSQHGPPTACEARQVRGLRSEV